MKILSPVRDAPATPKALARRPASLRGARVGVLDNSKPNAGTLLGRVAELLVERHGARTVSSWQKPGSSRPATVVDEIAGAVDVVLTGSGD